MLSRFELKQGSKAMGLELTTGESKAKAIDQGQIFLCSITFS